MINRVTEIKIKREKLSTIITATSNKLPIPVDVQLAAVCDWCKSADRVICHSDHLVKSPPNGLRMAPTKSGNMTVSDVLRGYAFQIPGTEVFAISAPNILINQNQEKFFEHVASKKMERAWAAYLTLPGSRVPVAFIVSATILPYIVSDMNNSLTFEGESWALWMHEWMSKFLLAHRYFDATSFELISPIVVPASVVEDAPTDKPKKVGRPSSK